MQSININESFRGSLDHSFMPLTDIPAITEKIRNDISLTERESYALMNSIMNGTIDEVQLSSILTAIRVNHTVGDEIMGFSEAMLANANTIVHRRPNDLIDIVGTGGAKFKTFNVSTTSSLILPLLGVDVAKHGNRSSTSKSGSADLLESLGVNITMSPEKAEQCLNQLGITFMFAPTFHPAMRNVAPVRRKLGIKTIFNLLGPLVNPAGVKKQLMGIFSPDIARPVINSLKQRGYDHVALVHNSLGADEITQIGETRVVELKDSAIREYMVNAQTFGVKTCNPQDISNLRPENSAIKCIDILRGEQSSLADFVAINSAMALRIAGKEDNLKDGVIRIKEKLDSGKALDLLEKFVRVSGGDLERFEQVLG